MTTLNNNLSYQSCYCSTATPFQRMKHWKYWDIYLLSFRNQSYAETSFHCGKINKQTLFQNVTQHLLASWSFWQAITAIFWSTESLQKNLPLLQTPFLTRLIIRKIYLQKTLLFNSYEKLIGQTTTLQFITLVLSFPLYFLQKCNAVQ